MSCVQKKLQVGNTISCWCGAKYELSYDDHAVRKKNDARCRFCRFVLMLWPVPFSLKLTKWPRHRKEAAEISDLAKNASTEFLRDSISVSLSGIYCTR
jgi:hypothetical protein